MRIFDLAVKDLRQIMRDRTSFLFLLVMPIVFTLLFGFAFGGNSTADPRLPVSVLDEDNSNLSHQLRTQLAQSDAVRIEVTETAVSNLQEQVSDGDLAAAIVIPNGFEHQMRVGEWQPVLVIAVGQAGMTVDGVVNTAVSRIYSAVQTAHISTNTAQQQHLLNSDNETAAYFDDALASALAAWDSPPVTVIVTNSAPLTAEVDEENSNYSVFAHSSPGMMAQFAIAALIGAAGILIVEKKTRSLQRLLTTNLSRAEILLGHYLAMFLLIFTQLTILILFGQLFLDLPYLSQPVATLLLTAVTALFCASLGLLISAIAKTEEQVIVFALLPMFILSALGGAWVPLEFTPETFQQIAFLTPLAWVMDGYKDVLVRGQGLAGVGTAVLVLAGYALVTSSIAVWCFRFD